MPTIAVTSIMVDDQDKALAFYTEKLGSCPGEISRWGSSGG
ncbi:VOC family protein [Enemella dayhoffiae]|nr:VOC family protein [Enemella dayhoffiae]